MIERFDAIYGELPGDAMKTMMMDVRGVARAMRGVGVMACAGLGALVWAGCIGSGAPGVDDCSNLRQVQAEGSGSISGQFGTLDDYEFAAGGDGSYSVIPPETSDCAREIAAKLEGACRVCDNDPAGCQTTVQAVLDTPSEACAACGDDLCQPSEDASSCPADCAESCGDGVCSGSESVQSCPTDCAQGGCGDGTCQAGETPVNCAEDCGTGCGDGTCDGDENAQTCPQDCTSPCGDGVCSAGENPTNCARDCGAPCGDGTCEAGESPLICPQDCGGCEPNRTTCDGDVLVVCNTDGVSSTRRDCGSGNTCVNGACRASDPIPGQTDAEALMLGNWRVVVELQAPNDAERLLDVGNAVYILEVFEITPPSGQFGVWDWKGALKADSMCWASRADFDAQASFCTPFLETSMGVCSQATCQATTEIGATGRYNSVTNELEIFGVPADIHAVDGSGYVALDIELRGTGTLNGTATAAVECPSSCSWRLKTAGVYEDSEDFPAESRYPSYNAYDWTIAFSKISD